MKRALPDHQAYFDPTSVLRDFMQLTRISSLIEDKVILELVPEREGSPLTLLEILVLRRVTPGRRDQQQPLHQGEAAALT